MQRTIIIWRRGSEMLCEASSAHCTGDELRRQRGGGWPTYVYEATVVAVEEEVAGGCACDRRIYLKYFLIRQPRPCIEYLRRHAAAPKYFWDQMCVKQRATCPLPYNLKCQPWVKGSAHQRNHFSAVWQRSLSIPLLHVIISYSLQVYLVPLRIMGGGSSQFASVQVS